MEKLTKCTGEGCLLKYECHRFTEIDYHKEEVFFVIPPFNYKIETCQYIWNDNAEELFKGLQRLSKPTN